MLHDEIGVSVIKVQSAILKDGGMAKFLQINEALFQLRQMLLLDLELFHRVHFARLLMHALVDTFRIRWLPHLTFPSAHISP